MNPTKSMLRVLAISLCLGQTALAQTALEVEAPSTDQTDVANQLVVRDQLLALGLTESETQVRLSALRPEDISVLAQNPKLNGKGGVKDKTLIIIAVILILPTLLIFAAL